MAKHYFLARKYTSWIKVCAHAAKIHALKLVMILDAEFCGKRSVYLDMKELSLNKFISHEHTL